MFVLSVEMIWLSEGKVLLVGRKLVFLCCSSTNRSDTFMKYPFDGRFASGFAINTGKSLGPAPTSWFHVFDGIGPHPLSATHRRLRLSLGLALACISIVDGFLYSPMQTLLNRVGCHKVASCARNQRNGVLVRLVSILYVSRSTASEFCRDVSKCDDERSKLQQIPLILSCVFSNPGRLEHGWSRGQACLCC